MASVRTKRAAPLWALGFGIVIAIVVAVVVKLMANPSAAAEASPQVAPPPNDIALLLDGLAAGQEVAGWKVTHIDVRSEPKSPTSAMIRLVRDASAFSVWVAIKGESKFLAPRSSARYDVFYSTPEPEGPPASEADRLAVVDAIVERLERTENNVPVPRALMSIPRYD